MKKAILLVLIFPFALQIKAQRQRLNLNVDWKMFVGDDSLAANYKYNDAAWKNVSLPRPFNEDEAFKVSIEKLSTGIVWYRKHLIVPPEFAGKKIFIEFEGIRQAGTFYINGKQIGISENGAMAFGFDISNDVNYGEENIIAARIDNAWNYREKATNSTYQWNDKNFNANYGGISKNVYLHVAEKLYQTLPLYSNLQTTGVYVYATNMQIAAQRANIVAIAEIKNEYNTPKTFTYSAYMIDAVTGKKATTNFKPIQVTLQPNETKQISTHSLVNNLQFWSWGYGYLYHVYTTISVDNKIIDAVKTTTGFRKTSFTNGYLTLNDRVLHLKGYAQRTSNEWPAIGASVPAWLSDYSNKLMVESNANLVRWMHITPWKQDVESCDRVGLIQAMPAADAEKDVDGRRWQHRTELMRDAIIYNRNNPSILFYESGNNGISEAHMKEMKAIRDKYDPFGGRAIGSRNMLDSKEAEYGGEMLYVNKSATKPMWQMEYSRDEGLRKYWDNYTPPYHQDGDGPLHNNQPAKEYNRNQESHAIENVIRWNEFFQHRPGTGKRANGGAVNIIFSETNTHHRGAENYRRSGEVDAMRIIKQNFYAHQIMWDGWVNVEKPRAHIIGHWNYDNKVVKDIFVIASAEKVELFVNGKSLGFGERSHHFLFTFKQVQWQAGTIEAKGFDKTGKLICTDVIKTAGKPTAIRLKTIQHPTGLKADGADVALIEVEVVDKNGQRCPTALNTIRFSLEGEAEWRGGIAQGPDNFILSKELPVECGVNRVLIRSTRNAGKIVVQAMADSLLPATIQLASVPIPIVDGLTHYFQTEGLKNNLSRGKTPLSPAYAHTIKNAEIIAAKAGSNEAEVNKSFDDNEATDWNSENNVANSWIEYELKNAAVIEKMHLKLNNFRTKSYPIQVFVDNKLVWKGNTEKSLGYCTLHFPPTKGKFVKIALMQESNVEANDNKEVNGKRLDDGVARNDANAKGKLSIIEIEIVEK